VVLGVQFTRLVAVVFGLEVMRMGDMRMMARLLVLAIQVRLQGLAVVLGGVLMVFGGLLVVLQLFFVGHDAVCFEGCPSSPGIGNAPKIRPECRILAAIT
jgi:hypothetical protein